MDTSVLFSFVITVMLAIVNTTAINTRAYYLIYCWVLYYRIDYQKKKKGFLGLRSGDIIRHPVFLLNIIQKHVSRLVKTLCKGFLRICCKIRHQTAVTKFLTISPITKPLLGIQFFAFMKNAEMNIFLHESLPSSQLIWSPWSGIIGPQIMKGEAF